MAIVRREHLKPLMPLRATHSLPALYFLLACLFFLVISWTPARADGDAPAGCEAVFGATSRGGSTASVGRGGCNFLRPPQDGNVHVVRVIDGDTIKISGGQRVRYIGIDTPEVGDYPQYYGPEAAIFNDQLLAGRKVYLEKDVSEKDRFGRLLRFVYAGGILVNAELVREGYARAKVFPPDTRHAQCFAALEQEAREGKRGIWGKQYSPSE